MTTPRELPIAVLLALVACSSATRGRDGRTSGPTSSRTAVDASLSHCSWSAAERGLRIGLCLRSPRLRLDEELAVEVRAHNVGTRPFRICLGCSPLWPLSIEGPGASPLGVPATPAAVSDLEFRALAPNEIASFRLVLDRASHNGLVFRLVLPGTYVARAWYMLDDGKLPDGTPIANAWSGRIAHQLAFDVIGETADGSPLDRHPGLRVLALWNSQLRPWLEREARSAGGSEAALYRRAAQLRPQVRLVGSYDRPALTAQFLDRCRAVTGDLNTLDPDRDGRFPVFGVGVGTTYEDHVSFVVALDDHTAYACLQPGRGPVP